VPLVKYASIDIGKYNYVLFLCIRQAGCKPVRVAWEKWSLQEKPKRKEAKEGKKRPKTPKAIITLDHLRNLTKKLEKHYDFLVKCNYFLVERQRAMNFAAVKIEQHTHTYLMIRVQEQGGNEGEIVQVSPNLKYTALNCPKELTKHHKKKWAVEKTKEYLEKRGDESGLELLEDNKGKADDLSDAYVQVEAFCKQRGLD